MAEREKSFYRLKRDVRRGTDCKKYVDWLDVH